MDKQRALGKAGAEAKDAAHAAAPWVTRLARLGYAAKGVVYGIVGVLALRAALGSGGRTTDPQGALTLVERGPLGEALLAVLALGLGGYALWRLVAAATDSEGKGDKAKGLAKRLGYAASGLAHLALAAYAVGLILDTPDPGGGGGSTQTWTGRLLGSVPGRVAVVAAGLGFVGLGLGQLYVAYKAKFEEKLDTGSLDRARREVVVRIGQFGIASRAVVLGVVGGFLVKAALEYDPTEARGTGGALAALASAPSGRWLLGLVAAGLVAYGLYCLVEALYRRIRPVA